MKLTDAIMRPLVTNQDRLVTSSRGGAVYFIRVAHVAHVLCDKKDKYDNPERGGEGGIPSWLKTEEKARQMLKTVDLTRG